MRRLDSCLLLAALVIFPFFFIGGFSPYAPRSWLELWDVGHIIFFAFGAYLLINIVPCVKQQRFYRQLFFALFLSFIAGALIELLQYGGLREVDIFDVLRGVVGAALAIAWCSPKARSINRYSLLAIKSLLVFMLLLQCYSVFIPALDEHKARKAFPLLAEFDSVGELGRWIGDTEKTLSTEQAFKGGSALKVQLQVRPFSGATLKYMPRDWRGYSHFVASIYSPEKEPLPLTIRIDDLQHKQSEQLYNDRFNRRFLLVQGWNTLTIDLQDVAAAPVARDMDLSAVATVGFFTSKLRRPTIIFIDNIYLE
ncbi:MAG: hypothetical protein WCY88_11145 [Spongiibacteraceae bacterium]